MRGTGGCPVCGSDDPTVHRDAPFAAATAVGGGSVQRPSSPVVSCGSCGLRYQRERPSDAELATLYAELDGSLYDEESNGRMRTARQHLGLIERFSRRGQLLDVGCASGAFLACAASAGWQIAGVEPSRNLFGRARASLGDDALVYNTTLERADLTPRSFDVVTAWDVLEHVADPVSFLGRCRQLLRRGGHVFLNVPDVSSVQARIFGSRWPLLLPSHLSYFDRSSLTVCARMAGLEVARFGRRPAWFSVRYLCARLSEHGVPGTRALARVVATRFPGSVLVPIFAGELYAVCRGSKED